MKMQFLADKIYYNFSQENPKITKYRFVTSTEVTELVIHRVAVYLLSRNLSRFSLIFIGIYLQ